MNKTAIRILTTQFVVLAQGRPSKIREKRNEVRYISEIKKHDAYYVFSLSNTDLIDWNTRAQDELWD